MGCWFWGWVHGFCLFEDRRLAIECFCGRLKSVCIFRGSSRLSVSSERLSFSKDAVGASLLAYGLNEDLLRCAADRYRLLRFLALRFSLHLWQMYGKAEPCCSTLERTGSPIALTRLPCPADDEYCRQSSLSIEPQADFHIRKGCTRTADRKCLASLHEIQCGRSWSGVVRLEVGLHGQPSWRIRHFAQRAF